MQKKIDKASIGIKFSKNFFDSEKMKDPQLDDTGATKAATNHFLGTIWLMNSNEPHFVTDNLV